MNFRLDVLRDLLCDVLRNLVGRLLRSFLTLDEEENDANYKEQEDQVEDGQLLVDDDHAAIAAIVVALAIFLRLTTKLQT